MRRLVSAVTFNPNGMLIIEYNEGDDVRENAMMKSHALVVPPSQENIDSIEALQESVEELLGKALEVFDQTPVAEREDTVLDEEEVSPWDNPNERDLEGEAMHADGGRDSYGSY